MTYSAHVLVICTSNGYAPDGVRDGGILMEGRHAARRLLGILVTAVALTVAPARADDAAPASHALDAETIVLANGLRVFLAPDPEARLVSLRVTYHAGQADDPPGLHGLAHLTEHMVGGRTQHIPTVLRTLIAGGAGAVNATTTADATSYFESVPPEHLEMALWVESDRMGFASSEVTDTRVAAERPILDNEERMRKRDAGLTAVGQAQMHEIFPSNHRYTTMGDEETPGNPFAARDVRAFLATWYWPSNATLALAGRFDREQALLLVRRYFEDLPSIPPPTRPPLGEALPGRVALEVSANTPVPSAWLAWRTPSFGAPGDAALDLAAAILVSDRMPSDLIRAHLATTVYAHQRSFVDGSMFSMTATCAVGVTPAQLARAMEASVGRLAKHIDADEVARAQAKTRVAELERLSSTEGRVNALESIGRLGNPRGSILDQALARQQGLTAADVAAAVARWLSPEHQVATLIAAERSSPLAGRLVRRVAGGP